MEDTTTDDVILPDEGAEESTAQPTVEDTQSTAAQEPAEPTQTEDQGPSVDDNLAWLQNKGIDPQSPEALAKVAEMYRNAEKQMHQSTAKASELEKSLTSGLTTDIQTTDTVAPELVTQLAAEVQSMKLAQNVQSFWAANPEAKESEAKMAEIVQTRPEIGQLVQAGYLSIQDLYNLTRGGDVTREANLKAEGGREALQKVATKQQAKAVVGNATSSDITVPDEDPFMKGFEEEA